MNTPEKKVSEIRRGKEQAEQEAFNRLKAELTHAFAAPEGSYHPLTTAEVIARNLSQSGYPNPRRVPHRLDDIFRYASDSWGNEPAKTYITGSFADFA